jgi:hypothetical protein
VHESTGLKIDQKADSVSGSIMGVAASGGGCHPADDAIWVVEAEHLRSVDLDTYEIGEPVYLGFTPRDMVYDGTRLWMTDGEHSVWYMHIMADGH